MGMRTAITATSTDMHLQEPDLSGESLRIAR
jgi:hypothetical protein